MSDAADKDKKAKLTSTSGCPVVDNQKRGAADAGRDIRGFAINPPGFIW